MEVIDKKVEGRKAEAEAEYFWAIPSAHSEARDCVAPPAPESLAEE